MGFITLHTISGEEVREVEVDVNPDWIISMMDSFKKVNKPQTEEIAGTRISYNNGSLCSLFVTESRAEIKEAAKQMRHELIKEKRIFEVT